MTPVKRKGETWQEFHARVREAKITISTDAVAEATRLYGRNWTPLIKEPPHGS